MAVIKKDGGYMGLPISIARGNPIPLDNSEIWYNFDEMVEYAKSNPIAYVGQILGFVDESKGTAKAYIILNTEGNIKEIGSATVVDNKTIILNDDNALSLKNFGVRYYRYVEESEDVAAHYVLQEVDDLHPWKGGLEPKVVLEDGVFVLGWYEPNPTTMEGVNAQISGIQATVNDLTKTNSEIIENISNNYFTKPQVESEISKAITASNHLQRVKLNSYDEIDPSADNAENCIYMIPTGLQEDDDKYDEYMVIDGVIEKVGSWEVNLSNYATLEDLKKKVDKVEGKSLVLDTEIAKLSTVAENAEPNKIDSVSQSFEILNKQLSLVSIPNTIDLSSNASIISIKNLIDEKVSKEQGKTLISLEELQKLANIQNEAEKNFISEVSEEFNVVDDIRKLELVSVSGEKVDISKNKIFAEVYNDVGALKTSDTNINGRIDSIINQLNNYLLKETYDQDMQDISADINDLKESLTWKSI